MEDLLGHACSFLSGMGWGVVCSILGAMMIRGEGHQHSLQQCFIPWRQQNRKGLCTSHTTHNTAQVAKEVAANSSERPEAERQNRTALGNPEFLS